MRGPRPASLAATAILAATALFAAGPVTARADPLPGAPPLEPELAARLERARAGAADHGAPRTRHLDPEGRPRFVNRLALEPSPYLLQHAFNPVNWYPWGAEAFAAARRLGRPVLISIGYSTCHWCHVMEEESFEDPEIAEYLNRHYVAIKVDREERPDIDGVYMTAVQAMTGHGGWPMTIWATPDGEPFYGGTYFPPREGARPGRPGFLTALERIVEVYAQQPDEVARVRGAIRRALREALEPEPSVGAPGGREIRAALETYKARFDRERGGVQSRQKFPGTLPISLLLRGHRRTGDRELLEMARTTLDAMRRGGIYDHVGGGFHRYTVEPTWTVPHFEKMLYDNALLASAYTDAWQLTGDPAYRRVARDVLDYVARDMTAPGGAFFAATDADSEGEEGRYFVWRPDQVRAAVGPELAELALDAYGLRGEPNFEGARYVLRRDEDARSIAARGGESVQAMDAQLAEIRARLRAARAKRVPPLRDDKQLVAWNGLMISAFARAGLAFRDPELVASGARAARALYERARPGGRLARYLIDGAPHGVGLLEDHAFLTAGLLDLFEATGEPDWLEAAVALQAELDRRFLDREAGGYWISPADGETLLARAKPIRDGARPSGNAIALANLLRLYHLTTDPDYRVTAEKTLRVFADRLRSSPTAHARILESLDFMLDTPREILIVTPEGGDGAEPFLEALGRFYLPNRVLVVAAEPEIAGLVERVPLLDRKRAMGGRATAYVCENRVCELPTADPAVFREQIARAPPAYAVEPTSGDAGPAPVQ